jgi:enoyl-CoA hydratase
MSVSLEMDGDVAVITMNDGKANAVNPTLLDALEAAMDKAEAEGKAIVLAGKPGLFSAGFDLKLMQGASPNEVKTLVMRGGAFAARLYGNKLPVVAACTGHAIAMGVFLLLGCDTRIGAAGEFAIGANETINNMVLPQFGIELPKARLNPQYLTEAVIQAKMYDPVAATTVGYLDQVVAPEKVVETATGVAAQLAQLPGQAYAGNKKLLRAETLAAIEASLAG